MEKFNLGSCAACGRDVTQDDYVVSDKPMHQTCYEKLPVDPVMEKLHRVMPDRVTSTSS